MLKNYLKLALRNLGKSKGSAFINIFGLSVSIGVSILVFLFLDLQNSMDRVHRKGDRIFLVEHVIEREGHRQLWGSSPMPIGPTIQADFPQVEQAVRVHWGGGTIQYEDRVFDDGFWFADPGFFEMFDFPLALGDAGALRDDNSVVLSQQAALRYFGEENPIGKAITIRFSPERAEAFTVRAVASKFPANVSFRFNMLLPFEKQRDLGRPVDDWAETNYATFIQLKRPADAAAVESQLARYLPRQHQANPDFAMTELKLANLYDLSRQSLDTFNLIANRTHPAAAAVLPAIAVFLLALSCFNYMNIALANAARRTKEIGVRKVMGGGRGQLVAQFLGENLLLSLVALILGVALAYFLFIPQWNGFFEGWPPVEFSLTANPALILFLIGLLAIVALASGAYPAYYIASFEAVSIFRGTQRLGGRSVLTRTLLGFQFVLAFLTMLVGMVMVENARYQTSLDWGYSQEQVLAVPLRNETSYATLADELRRRPDVLAVAPAEHHVGGRSWYQAVDVEGEKMEAERFDVGPGYFEVLGLRLKAGRFFEEARPGDAAEAALVNETFAREQGWADPVGRSFRVDSLSFTVVGVVADFHHRNFFAPIRPAFFRPARPEAYSYAVARLDAGGATRAGKEIEAAWKRLFPDAPYYGFFQDTLFDQFYTVNRNILKIFGFTALMSLVLSCMGLFGLASQNVSRRMKEIGVRKVLGASAGSVMALVNRSFFAILILAALVASPLAYFALGALLNSLYRFHAGVTAGPFVVAYLLIVATAAVTIATQYRRIAGANPAEVLRSE